MSLNELSKYLSDIADAHRQVNTYGFGDIWEFASSGVTHYPAVFGELENSRFENKVLNLDVALYFIDLVKKDESNELDVISDQILTMNDFRAQLLHPSYPFVLNPAVPFTDFTEDLKDAVAGVRGVFSFRIPIEDDRCAIPAGIITITTNTKRT